MYVAGTYLLMVGLCVRVICPVVLIGKVLKTRRLYPNTHEPRPDHHTQRKAVLSTAFNAPGNLKHVLMRFHLECLYPANMIHFPQEVSSNPKSLWATFFRTQLSGAYLRSLGL
jgi:hypothetical protein